MKGKSILKKLSWVNFLLITVVGLINGYYSDSAKTIIYFVVNRFQIGKMKSLVLESGSNAFVTISEIETLKTAIQRLSQ